ncbi:MAG: hypothetical protein GX847_09370 [Clostridiales bacterium]|nr:hypothetical protein [Clostridiales bacterium]
MMNDALRRSVLYIAVLAAAVMIIALVITAVFQRASADTAAVFTETQGNSNYWVRSHNGHIAVYNNKADNSPVIETVIDVESLRAVDRILLETAVGAATYEDVLKLLEDFGS